MNGISAAFTGRVTQEPELKYTAGGKPLLNISMAADVTRTAGMAEPPPPEWVKVACWDATAEQLSVTLHKGAEIYVEGRIKLNEWTAPDGQHRAGLNVSAWTVQVLGAIGKRAPRRQQED